MGGSGLFFLSGLVCAGSGVFLCVSGLLDSQFVCRVWGVFSPSSFCLAVPVTPDVDRTGDASWAGAFFCVGFLGLDWVVWGLVGSVVSVGVGEFSSLGLCGCSGCGCFAFAPLRGPHSEQTWPLSPHLKQWGLRPSITTFRGFFYQNRACLAYFPALMEMLGPRLPPPGHTSVSPGSY